MNADQSGISFCSLTLSSHGEFGRSELTRDMLTSKGFEIVIASPSDYEELVAEIYCDGLFVALVSQERGKGQFEVETPGRVAVEELVTRTVDADGLIKAIGDACRGLRGETP